MSKYETVAIPFSNICGRQCLTGMQLAQEPWLREFVDRFPHCFAAAPDMDIMIFYPEGDAPK